MRLSVLIVGTATLVLVVIGRPVGSQSIVPVDLQRQINTYTTQHQRYPTIGYDGQGNFVVVWESDGSFGNDDSSSSIQGRIYGSNGVPFGPEAQVNTYTMSRQADPDVAVNTDGEFVVVWTSWGSSGSDADGASIQGRIYNSNGVPLGPDGQVNTYTTDAQTQPKVAIDTDGGFVVIWDSQGSFDSDDDGYSIQGQLYASDGYPIGGQFQVNTYIAGNQQSPSVAMNADGAFVVVWTSVGSSGSDTDENSIQGRIYSSNGVPIGPEAQVNTYTTGTQYEPAVSVRPDGSFVVVWTSWGSSGSDDSGRSIQGRIYNSNGLPIGPDAQVNTYTVAHQSRPDIAADGEGNLLVVWQSQGSSGDDDSGTSIQRRLYDSNNFAVGLDYQINTYTALDQSAPRVKIDASGRGGVVWESFGSDGGDNSGLSVQGQRFVIGDIFTDGFETGDTSAWSSEVP